MGLGGTIPPHLRNLSFLVYLNISHNHFHGHLPNELGQLRRLRVISLTNNELIGSIPSWIGALSKLRYLFLQNNSFIGPIPDSLFNLSRLQNLDIMYNMIDGSIPSRIGNLSRLMNLNFGYNNLQGHLASTLGQSLPNLRVLILAQNKLIGTIPNSINNASKLQILELSNNSFHGHIPNIFGNLRDLRKLHLKSNSLTTESSSSAKWSFLSSLTSCRNLTALNFGSNPLRGTLPPLIGNFSSSLQYFYAFECQLKGNIPQEIGNLQGLILLSLYSNDLSGTIPTTMGRLQQLQGIGLADNHLQGSIPNDLCQLKRLNLLLLQGNKLSGSIPTCLASSTSLRELRLNSNKLTSSIPSALWALEYILYVNLSSNYLTGSLTSDIQNMKVLIDLDLSRNQLSGDIPKTIAGLKDLTNLSLAGNQFQGPIPESFGSLISLESLDLSSNNLSGGIPKSLVALSHLKQFNVSHNRLEGEIPTEGPFRNFSAQSFHWNYALCGPQRLQVPPCKEDKNKGFKKVALLVLKYIFPSIICVVLIALVFIFFLRRRNRSTKGTDDEELLSLATWRRTSYLDLERATDAFNECNLLGSGGFGSIYKGILSDGTNVAIKIFNLQLEQASRSFDSECEVLRNVRHRNLIKILSSCCNTDFKALVLEFMPNGSLDKWLYSHNYFLDIPDRLNIMIDVALALEYLHHGHSTPVVHCDLKPSNILLDENMVAHVSDFGISKLLGEGDDSVIQTMTIATIGYMAPEFGSEGIVSSKCDVYSYGILLLETFTRKKPTDEMFTGEMNLKNWVKESLPHGLPKIADANLLREENFFSARMDCLLSIFHLALDCCAELPDQRLYMKDAATKLKKIRDKFLEDANTLRL
ncbi:hypothetical protein WN944_019116 [Citrus x changshan-huyou]|uniref:non-specific serine/threonine protein kinase n=1 Tax=Citrus x changshan-huyou TaxID=2935761 RepID=A0AAP0LUM8_9ROSI